MLSNNNQKLQEAFHATQFWDGALEFQTQAKTNNPEADNLWWLDAYEVKWQKQTDYFGVLVPLKKSSASVFYKPILQKCYVVPNKIARSNITHDNATTIVMRKIVPAICYPSSVVRPTRAQIENLRSKIFEAAAFRKCQTQAAYSVFCEQTHHFDPESAMVYHNMRFWRRVFIQGRRLAQQLQDMLEQSVPPKQRAGKFPDSRKGILLPWIQQITKLQEDVASNCISTLVTCISHVPLENWKS